MNYYGIFILAFSLLAVASTASAQSTARKFVPGELILGYENNKDRDASYANLEKWKKSSSVNIRGGAASGFSFEKHSNTSIKFRIKSTTVTRGSKAVPTNNEEELQVLQGIGDILKKRDKSIKYAHPNWIMRLQRKIVREPVLLQRNTTNALRATSKKAISPNDNIFVKGLHWHYQPTPVGMNAVKAWSLNKGRRDVTIAVLDTGILFDHPDIKTSGNILKGYDFISPLSMANDGDGRDGNATDTDGVCKHDGLQPSWHGSHVAGTAGAATTNNKIGIAGVTWKVSILPVRVLGVCGGTFVDIGDAVRWAAGLPVKGVPQNKHPADVINMSLGATFKCSVYNAGYLIDAINAAQRAGAAVVVAAGNEDINANQTTPGGCQNVISVAASDQRGRLAPYSNFGAVTIMAPGGDVKRDDDKDGSPDGVWSLIHTSGNNPHGVAAYEGTSMAAPHVAAAIALLISHRKELKGKPDLIKKALIDTAVKPLPGACPRKKPCGAGQLDAVRLMRATVK